MTYRKKIEKALELLDTSEYGKVKKILTDLLKEDIIASVDEVFKPIEENCFNIIRNPENESWELNVGIPASWEVKDNDDIGFKILNESDLGKEIHIFPKNDSVLIDDLILFVNIIIKTNKEIEEKEKRFTEEIKKMKDGLEQKIRTFYETLETDKEVAFKNLGTNLEKEFNKSKPKKKIKNETTEEDGEDNEE